MARAGSPTTQVAFHLTALGTLAAQAFAGRAGDLGLSPPQSGLLRLVAREPGLSQREVAARLGTPPSRLVALVDELEVRGAIERRRDGDDRRAYRLHLTPLGRQLLQQVGRVAGEHERAFTASLDDGERRQLDALLQKLADAHGLTPGVHPGYRHLGAEGGASAERAGG